MGHELQLNANPSVPRGLLCFALNSGVVMFRPLFLMCLIGCEQIEPAGDPLRPVAIEEGAPPVDVTEAVMEAEDLEEEEGFTISSEELAAIADGGNAEALPPPPEEGTKDTPSEAAPPPPPPQAAAPPTPQAGTMPATGWPQTLGKAWPVRLVTTVPNASPPRAILGLPDGKEVVVNPGSMVPDLGLVVVAISPGSAELAKIAPAGDHATIESITLRAQY